MCLNGGGTASHHRETGLEKTCWLRFPLKSFHPWPPMNSANISNHLAFFSQKTFSGSSIRRYIFFTTSLKKYARKSILLNLHSDFRHALSILHSLASDPATARPPRAQPMFRRGQGARRETHVPRERGAQDLRQARRHVPPAARRRTRAAVCAARRSARRAALGHVSDDGITTSKIANI